MEPNEREKGIAIACLLGVVLAWGTIPIFLRYFSSHLDPWTVNGVRYLVGALFWLPFVAAYRRAGKTRANPIPGRSVWRDALIPTIPNAIGQVGYCWGPWLVPASTVGFAMRLSFLFTVVFGFLFLAEERPLARKALFWGGAALSLGGMALMFVEKLRGNGENWLTGLGVLVGATVAWGAYAVSVRKRMAPYPVRLSFGVVSLYTAVVLLGLMFWRGDVGALGELSAGVWACLVASGILGIALGHVLYYRGIHRLGPIVSSGVLLAAPLVTYTGAALTLGERMTAVQFLGGLSVITGAALLIKAKAQIAKTAG